MIAPALKSLAVPIASLNLDPANVRVHNKRNIESIKSSLVKFGQRKPIVVQKKGMKVRAGNGTLLAARELGWTEIAAVVLDDDDLTATAYGIADNRTAELAEWDESGLVKLLQELEADFPSMDLGFDDAEFQSLLLIPKLNFQNKEITPDSLQDNTKKQLQKCPHCGYDF